MARRKPEGSIWPKMLVVIVICLGVGVVGGSLFSIYKTEGLVPASSQSAVTPPETRSGVKALLSTPEDKDADKGVDKKLAKMSRPELEREVERLNEELTAKNRQIDELTIQMKLQAEGSRTAK